MQRTKGGGKEDDREKPGEQIGAASDRERDDVQQCLAPQDETKKKKKKNFFRCLEPALQLNSQKSPNIEMFLTFFGHKHQSCTCTKNVL